MDYTLYIKNALLKQSIGSYMEKLGKISYTDAEKIAVESLQWYVPKKIIKKKTPLMYTIFKYIDGITVNRGEGQEAEEKARYRTNRKDGYVDKEEIYQLIKDYYRYVLKSPVSNEEISEMKMTKLLDVLVAAAKEIDKIQLTRSKIKMEA